LEFNNLVKSNKRSLRKLTGIEISSVDFFEEILNFSEINYRKRLDLLFQEEIKSVKNE
jgi:hypothetical protein